MSTDPDASALTATDATEAFTVTAAVTPVQVDLGLDAFLTSLEQEAKTAGDKTLDPPLDPEVVQHLQTMGQLAAQLQAELAEINKLDPTALNRLKQLQQTPSA